MRAPAVTSALFVLRVGLWVALGVAVAVGLGACSPSADRPSILLVTLDTLRVDHVGAYGREPTVTPHLDALAAEGLVHESAYTTMPTTGPAHLSLFTGLYPADHGGRANGQPLARRHASRSLAARLADAGYATGAFVTTFLIGAEETGLAGFRVYDAPGASRREGRDAVDAALAWLGYETQRPVFLWVHLYDAHAPYGTSQEKRKFRQKEPLYGFVRRERYASTEERARMRRQYARGVQQMDRELGRLVQGFHKRVVGPAFVVVVADHGENFAEHLAERGWAWDHGEYLDPESVKIPLVVTGPGVVPGRSPGTVSIRDLYTTLLEAAGLRDPDAAREGRRNLRQASDRDRAVRIERRTFQSQVPDSVRRHAAAAADGVNLVVVGEDGAPTSAAGPDGLLELARDGLVPQEPARDLSPETRKALEELGYAE
jgi:arylsulfatase A-like enzyme